MTNNEEKFVRAATTDEAFRNALRDKDLKYLSKALDELGIVVDDKVAVLDEIAKVDWSNLNKLDELLSKRFWPLN